MTTDYDDDISAMLRYGVSEELIGHIDAIATTTTYDDRQSLKYPKGAINELRKSIVCRNFGNALWELAHLFAALAAPQSTKMTITSAIWGAIGDSSPASSGRFRELFAKPVDNGGVALSCDEKLTMRYPGGSFDIAPSRFSFLSALAEFVGMTTTAFTTYPGFLLEVNKANIDALARQMQSEVGAYLKEHMQPEHHQRKARELIKWLAAKSYKSDQVDDEVVLEFWQRATERETKDFKQFNTVAEGFLYLLAILSAGRDARSADFATLMGDDRDAGDISFDQLDDLMRSIETENPVLEDLLQPPIGRVKFVMKKEAAALESIDKAGAARTVLPITLYRMKTLGAVQHRITQHLRDSDAPPPSTLLDCDDAQTYTEYDAEMNKRRDKLRQTRAATLHLLRLARHPEATACAIESLDDEARASVRRALGEDAQDVLATDASVLPRLALQVPELSAVLSGWADKFDKVNRAGFTDTPHADDVDNYAAGLRLIEQILNRLKAFQDAFQHATAQSPSGPSLFERDRALFGRVYSSIYGDHHD